MEKFANRLRQAMEIRDINTAELSRRTKIGKSSISQWVNGKYEAKQDKIYLLADKLEVDPAWLIGADVPMNGASKAPTINNQNSYNFINAGIAAGIPTSIDPFYAQDIEQIQLPDSLMGRYAGSPDVFISRISGDSMNKVLPDQSLVAIKRYENVSELNNRDIVVFEKDDGYSVKRFFNMPEAKVYMFKPESTDDSFDDLIIRYEDADNLKILGKVVVYVVEL
ncbi:S24 family peptidase [Paucilactobacillus sp. N302-9]